jgi:hypothetical protein
MDALCHVVVKNVKVPWGRDRSLDVPSKQTGAGGRHDTTARLTTYSVSFRQR